MEKVFFELYENQSCMAVEVGHNSIAGWCINIYDVKGKKLGETHDAAISIKVVSQSSSHASLWEQFLGIHSHRGRWE